MNDEDGGSRHRHVRVAGVPEHFNEPWRLGIEEGIFNKLGIEVEWHPTKEGTGAMINKLKTNEVDLVVALTEGLISDIANGSEIRLLGTYVQSPLRWSISTGSKSSYHSVEDLKGQTFGISRYQSGSHLMSCVLANQYGWRQSDIQFIVNNNFETLRRSVNDNSSAAFLWEYFMQKPFYDKGEIRQLGEILTPWPCFMIASTQSHIRRHSANFERVFLGLEEACSLFRRHGSASISRISSTFGLSEQDARSWFEKVRIAPTTAIAESVIETTIDALKSADLLKAPNKRYSPKDFIDENFSQITIDIKSMRLYNKPELLIMLRNNLRVSGLSKGDLSYRDLLPFDQNHYYGTAVLDVAVEELQLSKRKPDENSSDWIIQIGSNLAGCARYLAGKYNLKVLAVELQNDLSQQASELTDRCHLTHLVHHIAGDFIAVSQHLQENFYSAIVSWLTLLHFNRAERRSLIGRSYRLLRQNGYFYFEDFVRVGPITSDESQILEHDVFCRYLPTLDEVRAELAEADFEIVKVVDLTDDWKKFTVDRLSTFRFKRDELANVHGEDIYLRLEYFFAAIVRLFVGDNVGGVRVVAKKISAD